MVCLGGYDLSHEVCRLPCQHLFHAGCIDSWLERETRCPICQQDLITEADYENFRVEMMEEEEMETDDEGDGCDHASPVVESHSRQQRVISPAVMAQQGTLTISPSTTGIIYRPVKSNTSSPVASPVASRIDTRSPR